MNRWLLNTSLAHHYPYLFLIATDTQISVAKAIVDKQLNIFFRIQLVRVYYEEWCDLQNQIRNVSLPTASDDVMLWRWSSTEKFSVHSLYEWLEFGGTLNTEYSTLWLTNIPLKLKILSGWLKKIKFLSN
jgi:hypothetical protein